MAGSKKTPQRRAVRAPACGVVDVVWCPNPMRPVADRKVRRLVLTGSDTVGSIVRRLGLVAASVSVTLDGCAVARKRWYRKRVRPESTLVVVQQVHGFDPATLTAKLIMDYALSYATATALATLAYVGTQIGIALAISTLANGLMRKDVPGGSEPAAALATYSIEGGSNEARPYSPLPLVLGEHRVFPDYASRPFVEYVPDPTTEHEVINSTPAYALETPPAWSAVDEYDAFTETWTVTPVAPWTLIVEESGIQYYGDNADRTYTDHSGNPVTQPHTFVVRHIPGTPASDGIVDYESYSPGFLPNLTIITWQPVDGADLNVVQRYGYLETENVERLTSIFNFGLGDLTLSDYLIGSTPQDSYNAWQRHQSAVPAGQRDRTELKGYSTDAYPWGDAYPDDVQVVDGGKLEQREDTPNSGWVERTGRAARFVQIDVAGRLFRQDNGGIEQLTCEIEAQYRATGSAVWTDFSFSPVTLSNGDTTVLRHTFAEAFAFDVDAVRVRRVTPEPTEAREVSELELTRVKYFRPQTALYPAQRRVGLMIRATGQLNGRIDRFSAFAKAKHWVWTAPGAWTGSFPESGAGAWAWQDTVNPAWLFLYYARGGFLNTDEARGWRDYPHPDNGARIFGAGLVNDRIDYASIVAWGQWCDANNLECRMVVVEQRSAGEVLDAIASAGRASKSWATGKLSVVWEGAGQPWVAAFGMANIAAGSFEIGYDTDTTVHEIALQYTRSDAEYQPDTVYAAVPGVAQVVNQRAEQAVYAMPQAQAQRLANLLAASRYYHRRTIRWESHLEALSVQRGDIVHLAHDLTRWAFSGRLIELVVDGGSVVQARLSCEVDNAAGDDNFYLWVRKPDGSYMSVQCTPPAQRTELVDVLSSWDVEDAPGTLGGSADADNLASSWPDTVPEDWMFLAGPTATPGKRVRITGMESSSHRKVRITARDEDEAYYPLEYGLGGAPEPTSGERLVARAFNLDIEPAAAGGHRLSWELENAHGAEVMLSVNGGAPAQVPTQGALSVLGTEVLLPAYAAGTELSIELLPIAAGTPVAVEGDSLVVEV